MGSYGSNLGHFIGQDSFEAMSISKEVYIAVIAPPDSRMIADRENYEKKDESSRTKYTRVEGNLASTVSPGRLPLKPLRSDMRG